MSSIVSKLIRATLFAGALGVAASASAEELKLGHFMSANHALHRNMMTPWAEQVAKQSNNKLTVRIFPSSQLGGKPGSAFKMAADGISDISFGIPGYTSSQFPALNLTELPGFAGNQSEANATEQLWKKMKYFEKEFPGVKVLVLLSGDLSVIVTKNKAIRTPADLKGLRIRVPTREQGEMVEFFGGVVSNMPLTEVYNALDRGLVDAAMVPIAAAGDFKLNEVGKYYLINAPLTRSLVYLVMNQARYNSLAPDQKALIDATTGKDLSVKGANVYAARRAEVLADIKSKKSGELIELSPAEIKQWEAALKPFVEGQLAKAEKNGVPARAIYGK